MRSLIYFFITTFISLQFANAGHLEQINVRTLPQDENITNNLLKMKALEPYVEYWVYEWNFKIGKDKVINEINALYSEIAGYLKNDSLNGELFLYSGLIAHYAYNLDLQEYWELAEAHLLKARELMKGDFRPDWFLGLHYIQSDHIKEGMNVFLNITKERDIENGLFWEDYAMSSYFSQMFQNTLMGLDKAKEILGEDSDYEKLFGKKIRKKISVPGKKSKIEIRKLWNLSKSDSLINFVSFPLGYRISIPLHWKVRPFPYQKRAAGLYVEIEPIKGIHGDMLPTMTVSAHVAGKKENIEDFIKNAMNAMKFDVSFEKYNCNLGLNESSYIGINSVLYPEEGGARIILVYFERNEPEYKGIRLERPREFSNTSEGANFYSLNADKIFSRFNGKLFYVIVLECSESIFEKSLAEFNRALKSFIVE
jgi:hypothetical protein